MKIQIGLLALVALLACFVSIGFVQTTTDIITGSMNYPGSKCEGEDSGNTFDCKDYDTHWLCELNGGYYMSCKNGGTAELGICIPKWNRYCVHKGFGWTDGDGKQRGCYGMCGGTVCTYAPDENSCHDDFWWPTL